ncbi:beta-N-acetylhexosaminidase [Demequina muriae]|uniref:Beta-N-acetylhexosaminidase n=1 Tax=Demequina muriae TaxID=3051664 RepID=A0ABT8GHN3_9MICO|nr:beta-N-acetylhexosaminidase [Demequina sp. EGI L300058]MDN4480943.1 beta-N-acetylhexosaminidase [Demequina sp. EGI L300058]
MSALATLMPGFEGTVLPAWVERRLRDGMGGVCLFATNVESPEQLRSLTASILAANPRAVISTDEEGGDVSRLHQRDGSPFPGNAVLGRLDDLALTQAVGEQVGHELIATGVNLTLAPDVDINSNVSNPVIGVRSFGADADLVSRHGAAWTRGVQSAGVAGCAKHFPGHGDTSQDSHVSLPTVDVDLDTLRARELAPFAAAIEAGVATIMSSHIVVPALDPDHPATFSRPILTDLLRGEMGFEGVIVSDALDMVGASGEIGIPAAAVRALHAGCDLLCIGTANTDEQIESIVDAIEQAVAQGEIAEERIAEASTRIDAMVGRLTAAASDPPGVGLARLDHETVRRAFRVSARAAALLESRRAAAQPLHWIRLESSPNIAVGTSPWGVFAVGVTADVVVRPGDGVDLDAVPHGALVVVVGKNNHRHPWAQEVVDALRPLDPVVVDMGWPDLTEPYADIATYGASRLVGAALAEVFS